MHLISSSTTAAPIQPVPPTTSMSAINASLVAIASHVLQQPNALIAKMGISFTTMFATQLARLRHQFLHLILAYNVLTVVPPVPLLLLIVLVALEIDIYSSSNA